MTQQWVSSPYQSTEPPNFGSYNLLGTTLKTGVKRDSAANIAIRTVIPARLVPMIANLSVGMSMKLVSMHVLVATDRTVVAMETGAAENQIRS